MLKGISKEHQTKTFSACDKSSTEEENSVKLSEPFKTVSMSSKLEKSKTECGISISSKFSAALEKHVNINKEIEPFFVVDLNSVVNQHQKWKNNLPIFTPFYAVKCNNDPIVLKTLINLDTNFDCASMEEIKTILDLGVSPDRIIYANPCKAPNHIKYAAEKGVLKTTFDNAEELYKVKNYHPKAELVIRIQVDDSKSICQLGIKFGVPLGNTRTLLELAFKLGLKVIGVSFHVGSGCTDASAFEDAIKRAKDVFEEAKEVGYNFTLLDIGGGFPGLSGVQNEVKIEFEEIAEVINNAIEAYFKEEKEAGKVEFIAEPGRFFCSSAFSLVTNITSKRSIARPATTELIDNNSKFSSFMYYINDGVYGSFNCLIFDHAVLPYPSFLIKNSNSGVYSYYTAEHIKSKEELFESSLWGPTCDSMDLLTQSIKLPELSIGDWLLFENMGAYTLVAASRFNGMNKPKIYYLDSESDIMPLDLKPTYNTCFLSDQRALLIDEDFDS